MRVYAVQCSAVQCTTPSKQATCYHRLTCQTDGSTATATRHWSRAPSHCSTRPSRKLTACSVSVRLSALLWPTLAELPHGTTNYSRRGGWDGHDRPASYGASSDGCRSEKGMGGRNATKGVLMISAEPLQRPCHHSWWNGGEAERKPTPPSFQE